MPSNTTATVMLPATDAKFVTESGQPVARAQGVKLLRTETRQTSFTVNPAGIDSNCRITLQRQKLMSRFGHLLFAVVIGQAAADHAPSASQGNNRSRAGHDSRYVVTYERNEESTWAQMIASRLVCLGLLTLAHLTAGRELLGAELTVYPPLPNNQYGSEIYEVTVSQGHTNRPSYVYKSTREGGNATDFATDANHWTSFSFRGAVTVQVKLRDGTPVKTAVIRPFSRNIRAESRQPCRLLHLDGAGQCLCGIGR